MGWRSCSRITILSSTVFAATICAVHLSPGGFLFAQSSNNEANTGTTAALAATRFDFATSSDSTFAKEPMIVEHPSGTLFVSGYGWEDGPEQKVAKLWKSVDHGKTWTSVNVGTEADEAVGNSDVDLAMATDGTLYFGTMIYDNTANEGRQVSVGVSQDLGNSWHWTTLSK